MGPMGLQKTCMPPHAASHHWSPALATTVCIFTLKTMLRKNNLAGIEEMNSLTFAPLKMNGRIDQTIQQRSPRSRSQVHDAPR